MRPTLDYSKYPIFEANQVLTNKQLNNFFNYLDEQERLTRANLIGIGIVCGLELSIAGTAKAPVVRISKGCGITSHGYLIVEPVDLELVAYKKEKYKLPDNLPYPLFKDIDLWEMFTDDEPDTEFFKDEPSFLNDKVALLFLELKKDTLRNCSLNNCDDKGSEISVTLKRLLVSKNDRRITHLIDGTIPDQKIPSPKIAEKKVIFREVLGDQPIQPLNLQPTLTDLEHQMLDDLNLMDIRLPRVNVPASTLSSSNTIFAAYLAVFRNAKLAGQVGVALTAAYHAFHPIVKDAYPTNPFSGFAAKYGFLDAVPKTNAQVRFLQYYYDFFDDLIKAYDEFRWKGAELMCACCPPDGLFPRHLLLGLLRPELSTVNDPRVFRHHFLASAAISGCEERIDELLLLFRRLVEMTLRFTNEPPLINGNLQQQIRITPSKLGDVPISEKCIPYYYLQDGTPKLFQIWNAEKSRRNRAHQNLSYRSYQYGLAQLPDFVSEPLRFDLEPNNFLRIEGHLGKDYIPVVSALQALKKINRLPIEIIALRTGAFDQNMAINIDVENCHFQDLETLYDATREQWMGFLSNDLSYLYGLKAYTATTISMEDREVPIEKDVKAESGSATVIKNTTETAAKDLLKDTPVSDVTNTREKEFIEAADAANLIKKAFKDATEADIVNALKLAFTEADDAAIANMVKRPASFPSKFDFLKTYSPGLLVLPDTLGWRYENEFSATPQLRVNVAVKADFEQVNNLFFNIFKAIYDLVDALPPSLNATKLTKAFNYAEFSKRCAALVELVKELENSRQAAASAAKMSAFSQFPVWKERFILWEETDDRLEDLRYNCRTNVLKAITDEFAKRILVVKGKQFFSKFIEDHPGIQHKAGVPLGGTFIVVYHDGPDKVIFNADNIVVEQEATLANEIAHGVSQEALDIDANFAARSGKATVFTAEFESALKRLQLEAEFAKNKDFQTLQLALTGQLTDPISSYDLYANTDVNEAIANFIKSIPDRTILFDFFLPYICCSDCTSIQYVLPPLQPGFTYTVLCTDDNGNAQVSIIPQGGTPAYSYKVGSDGQGTYKPLLGNIVLSVGEHSVTLRDAANTESLPQTIEIKPKISLGEETYKCANDFKTYTVTFDVSGGSVPYKADFGTVDKDNKYVSDPIATGVAKDITIIDSKGCQAKKSVNRACKQSVNSFDKDFQISVVDNFTTLDLIPGVRGTFTIQLNGGNIETFTNPIVLGPGKHTLVLRDEEGDIIETRTIEVPKVEREVPVKDTPVKETPGKKSTDKTDKTDKKK